MALIPPQYLDCVVAVGIKNPDGSNTWIGTGFFVRRFLKKEDDGRKLYHVFLVTNKHVFSDKNSVVIRVNAQPRSGEPAREYNVQLVDKDGNRTWIEHPADDIDVGVTIINPELLRQHGMRFAYFLSDNDIANISQMIDIGVTEGDYVYVLGYPMGIVAPDRQYVIARSGSIARIRDLLEKRSKDFIVDAFVFPGNSGGPVIFKPEIVSIEGTKAIDTAYLIGLVKSYIPYQDVAISEQTKRPRIVFEENSGLAAVIPVEFVMETIEICFEKVKIVDKTLAETSVSESSS
jgi:S1-C subfamily serine protease